MNGIEKITARIAADADREIAKVQEESAAAVEKIRATYAAKTEAEVNGILERGKKAALERKDRLANMAQMESKKDVLAAKQEMLDQVFEGALTKLVELPEEEMVKLLSELAAKASISGTEEIIFSAADRDAIGAKTVEAANRILSAKGKNAGLVLAERTAQIRGGFLLNDKNVEVNCAFETLVRLTRGSIAGQVAKVLFD
ncbi:MAG: hypothetical protein IKU83_06360 [Lachnospiraceae bacterium]|nr:hypothetical protein [Lachnospiraceae bacterium]